MDFIKYVSTPAGRTEADPLVSRIELTRGRLAGGCIYFPAGPAGVLHVLARIGIHQILPFNTGENIRLDDCVFPFTLGIDLAEPPYYIDVVTWNDSSSYAHAMTILFSLDPKPETLNDLKKLIEAAQSDR